MGIVKTTIFIATLTFIGSIYSMEPMSEDQNSDQSDIELNIIDLISDPKNFIPIYKVEKYFCSYCGCPEPSGKKCCHKCELNVLEKNLQNL